MSSRLQQLRNGRLPFRRNPGEDGEDKLTGGFQFEDADADVPSGTGLDPNLEPLNTRKSTADSPTPQPSTAASTRTVGGGGRRTFSRTSFDPVIEGGRSFGVGSDDPEQQRTAMEALLEFQYVNFPKRITERGGQRERLKNYFPWVELRKRTTPLPSVAEYLVGIDSGMSAISNYMSTRNITDAKRFGKLADMTADLDDLYDDSGNLNIPLMFKMGNDIFGSKKSRGEKSGSIIILFRYNGNTQIIFPGLSTTSYQSKGGILKDYVWTSSVEFQSFNFSALDKGFKIGEQNLKLSEKSDTVEYKRLWGKIDGQDFLVNLELTDSVRVAEDYLFNQWLPSKAVRAQERLGYRVFLFQEIEPPNEDTGAVTVNFGGWFNVAERLAMRSGRASDQQIYQMISEESQNEFRTNPSKRLPSRSKSSKHSSGLSRRSKFKKRHY